MDKVLSVQHVSKSFSNKIVLHDISLDLHRGEIYGLVGRNGSGKTTLIKIITGVTAMDSGQLCLFDNPNARQERYRLGSLIESPALFDNLTGRQNLEYFRRQRGFVDPLEVTNLLAQVGLANYIDVKVKKYSLGMRQRLSIALAMLGKPDILILDEPINGIDPSGIVEMRILLRELVEKYQISILISSHILEELSQLAHRFGILDKGMIVDEVTREQLVNAVGKYLVVETTDSAHCCAIIEQEFGIFNYNVVDRKTIHIHEAIERAAEINRVLITKGAEVSAFYCHRESLEDYYMRILECEGHRNA